MSAPASDTSALRLNAEIAALDAAQAFLAREAEAAQLRPEQSQRLALALEEVFVNVCDYAYPADAPGWIELRASRLDGRFLLEVLDAGRAFDGPALATPDVTASLDEREAGGFGWYLVRRMVSEVHYRREAGLNVVQLILDSPLPAQPAG